MEHGQWRVGRRRMLLSGLLQLSAAAGATVAPLTEAQAARRVTPNPIRAAIRKSGLAVDLVDFSAPPRTSGARPYAMLNFLYHAGDGIGPPVRQRHPRQAVADRPPHRQLPPVPRSRARPRPCAGHQRPADGPAQLRLPPGLRPRRARPGYRKLYTVSTETRGSRPAASRRVRRAPFRSSITMWSPSGASLPAIRGRSGPTRGASCCGSPSSGRDHNTDQLMFDPQSAARRCRLRHDLIGVGDGGNNPPQPDPYDQAQNPGSALARSCGSTRCRSPTARPTASRPTTRSSAGAGWLPEIWALGLRHPQNFSFDSAAPAAG